MEHINEMLWRVLFKERNVSFSRMEFSELHHVIFPCVDLFDSFLHADSTEKMIASAKEINSNILFSACISPSPLVYQGLINAESNYPAAEKNEFISQDHVVHSVNVYLLGIYLFFNHQLLHDRVYDFFRQEIHETGKETGKKATLQFVDCWKIFAFCHDIGYPFEKLVNTDGVVRKQAEELFEWYRNLGFELKYDRIMRSTAILMFTTVICNRSLNTLQDLLPKCDIDWTQYIWIGADSAKMNKSELLQHDWSQFYRLYSIHSYADLKCLFPLISMDDIVVVLHDSEGEFAGLKFENASGITALIPKKGIQTGSFCELDSKNFTYDFYCRKPEKVLERNSIKFNMARFSSADNWVQIAESFCEPEVSMLENNKSDCLNAAHKVYCRLREFLNAQDMGDSYEDVRKRHSIESPEMTEIVLHNLRKVLQGITESKTDYKADYKTINEVICTSLADEEFFRNTISEISTQLNPLDEAQYTIWNVLHSTFCRNWGNNKRLELPPLFSGGAAKKQYVCACTPLEFPGNRPASFSGVHGRIVDALKNYLIDIEVLPEGEDMTFFTRYAHEKAKYDHGVMGTHILLYTASLQHYFSQIKGYQICTLNSSNLQTAPEPEKAIVESLGAILVHNIYTQRYKDLTGISYRLTLDKHPLAYFGALCDALQLWDRHHSVDQSRRILTNFNPARSHVALEVHGKTIVLTCETNNTRRSGDNQRASLEQFLKCGGSLLKVNFIEEPI